MQSGQDKASIATFSEVIRRRPAFAEGWNKRATVHYLAGHYRESIADCDEVLKRNPAHFGAISGLGMILHEFGDDKRALDAFRRAVAIHPHLQKIPDLIKSLIDKVEGRDI